MTARKISKLSLVHSGEMLLVDFLEPLALSQDRLAHDVSVPRGASTKSFTECELSRRYRTAPRKVFWHHGPVQAESASPLRSRDATRRAGRPLGT